MAVDSVITAGVIISGASVSIRFLSQDVRVNSYSDVDSSIIFRTNIGRHCRIKRAIIDRDVHIPEGTVIGYDPVGKTSGAILSRIVMDDRYPRCVAVRSPWIRTSCSGIDSRDIDTRGGLLTGEKAVSFCGMNVPPPFGCRCGIVV
jgi:hypothetical protein